MMKNKKGKRTIFQVREDERGVTVKYSAKPRQGKLKSHKRHLGANWGYFKMEYTLDTLYQLSWVYETVLWL